MKRDCEPVCDYQPTDILVPIQPGASMTPKLTPIEKRIDDILNDGMDHETQELLRCIDSLAGPNLLKFHMHNLRNKLEPCGFSIVTRIRSESTIYYKVRRIRND